jgi:hypothetical protein
MRPFTLSSSLLTKVLASAALVGSAAAIAGLGTYATYTGSAAVSHTVGAGTVSIVLGATGASTNRLNIGASNIVPGDTIQRAVNLGYGSSNSLGSVTLTTAASPSSVLDTDATNGLQMVIDKCSVAWTEAGVAPAYTYTCGGTTTSVLASRAVTGTNLALSNLALTGTDFLRVTLTFPSASTIGQGASSTISYTFTGTQRAATNQ